MEGNRNDNWQAEDENWPAESEKTIRTIPVIEENIHIGKKIVETGRVRIVKTVSEEEALVETALLQEEMQVERIPVNQYIDTPPPVRYEGEVMIIPVIQEVVVIEKRLMLVEEIRVNKHQTERKVSETVTLRKEEINIERSKTDANNSDLL